MPSLASAFQERNLTFVLAQQRLVDGLEVELHDRLVRQCSVRPAEAWRLIAGMREAEPEAGARRMWITETLNEIDMAIPDLERSPIERSM